MRRKQKKSSEEKIAENYFPVEENDLKYTIEKEVKQLPQLETIEKQGTKRTRPPYKRARKSASKIATKKTTKKTTKTSSQKFEPANITLKKNGYELIITEKPQAASKIATALDDKGSPKKFSPNGVTYYEIKNNGKEIIVGCAVGHLFTLKQQTARGTALPIFDISWIPNFLAKKGDFTKKYYDTLLKLAKGAGSLTVATDYDVEGEVIGYNIVKQLAGQEDASRMKFSTLTEKELQETYKNKASNINWGQALAGESRHYLDWFYGINLSRALMNAIKTTGSFKIMSAGRVQGPTLKLIVDKEKEIQAFKSEPYWQVFIDVESLKDKSKLKLKHNKDLFDKNELKKFENLKDEIVNVETKKTQQVIPPQEPFNLTTLQTEAYKFHGFTPSRTLQIAQSLYLAGNISYPRTSSQKLPPSIGYKDILKKVALQMKIGPSLLTREKPVEGKKTDPAHPSIYPTGQLTTMNYDEEKLYNLIAKRFLALFAEDAILDNKTIKATPVKDPSLIFSTRGSQIREKGWMSIYPTKLKEVDVKDMNGEAKIKKVSSEEKETQPPKRYSPASIVSELEKRNLGTKATRANIIETLYDRNYIKEKAIEATSLGISLIETLEKHSPIIIDEQLTRHFEEEMEELQEKEKLEEIKKKENEVIEEAKKTIRIIIEEFESKEKEIGKELVQATQELREEEKKANVLFKCPNCEEGQLAITYSPRFKRQFIACNAYPKCKTTYSLPPGTIKKIKVSKDEAEKSGDDLKKCDKCGFPLLMSVKARRKPWVFCFNKECETNKERLEEYYKKKEAEENN